MSRDEAVVLLDGIKSAGETTVEAEASLRAKFEEAQRENRALAEKLAELQRQFDIQREEHALERSVLLERATVDPLTGVPNRGGFDERFAAEERRAMRTEGALSLLMIDLDFFKKVNDVGGHAAGDAVLRSVGNMLQDQTRRETEFAARIGGEEFAVILSGVGTEEARAYAERLRLALGALAISRPDGGIISASIGVSTMIGAGVSRESLFERADQALYMAKESGRDRVVTDEDRSRVEYSVAGDAFYSDFGPTNEELRAGASDDVLLDGDDVPVLDELGDDISEQMEIERVLRVLLGGGDDYTENVHLLVHAQEPSGSRITIASSLKDYLADFPDADHTLSGPFQGIAAAKLALGVGVGISGIAPDVFLAKLAATRTRELLVSEAAEPVNKGTAVEASASIPPRRMSL